MIQNSILYSDLMMVWFAIGIIGLMVFIILDGLYGVIRDKNFRGILKIYKKTLKHEPTAIEQINLMTSQRYIGTKEITKILSGFYDPETTNKD